MIPILFLFSFCLTGGLGSVGPSLENLAGGGGGGGGGGGRGGGGGGLGMGGGMGAGMGMGGEFGGKDTIVFCLVLKRFHECSIQFYSPFFHDFRSCLFNFGVGFFFFFFFCNLFIFSWLNTVFYFFKNFAPLRVV